MNPKSAGWLWCLQRLSHPQFSSLKIPVLSNSEFALHLLKCRMLAELDLSSISLLYLSECCWNYCFLVCLQSFAILVTLSFTASQVLLCCSTFWLWGWMHYTTAPSIINSSSREWWSCMVCDTTIVSGYPPWVPQGAWGSKVPVGIVELPVSLLLSLSNSLFWHWSVATLATASTVLVHTVLRSTLWAIYWMFIICVV